LVLLIVGVLVVVDLMIKVVMGADRAADPVARTPEFVIARSEPGVSFFV
jgi:hypothetical protein